MNVSFRRYHHPEDYFRVDDFLIRHYMPGNEDGNWLEPAWEYMHGHPLLEVASLEKIGVWESSREIVAVVHYEWHLGEAFFQFDPGHKWLRTEMLKYAETNLPGISERGGRKFLAAYVNDNDEEFLSLVKARGYEKNESETRPVYRFDIPELFPAIHLPAGYRLTSLAEECDWAKVNRVLWRGFDHPGEPPDDFEELESRRKMFDTPKARRSLKIAIAAPNGDFVAFCGMFYEPTRQFAYVEPVATDPDHRRLGLGRAAVLEGIRRCAALGATAAYVGSDQLFYRSLGFKKVHNSECWMRIFAS